MSARASFDQREVSLASLELYAECGADYDRQLLHDCQYRTPTEVARLFQRFVEGSSGHPWLDLGAGTGLVGHALNAAKISLNLFALDNSRAMLGELRSTAYVACYRADALDPLPFAEASLPGIFAIGLSEHIVDLKHLFANVAAHLMPGGWFFFSYCPSDAAEFSREESGFFAHSPALVRRALNRHALELVIEQRISAYQSGPEGWVEHAVVVARRHSRL